MSRYVEDPSIAQTAALELDRVWDRIVSRTAGGMWFFRAREIILAEEVPFMWRTYGKEVAQRVQRAVQHREPPAAAIQAAIAPVLWNHIREQPGLRGVINRWFFRLTGYILI